MILPPLPTPAPTTHSAAHEVLRESACQVDRHIAEPLDDRSGKKTNQFHVLMVFEVEGERKNVHGAPVAYPRAFSSSARPRILPLMDELEKLRKLVGPEAGHWTTAQLERLRQDIDAMAALLLDVYRERAPGRRSGACGLPKIDVPQTDR